MASWGSLKKGATMKSLLLSQKPSSEKRQEKRRRARDAKKEDNVPLAALTQPPILLDNSFSLPDGQGGVCLPTVGVPIQAIQGVLGHTDIRTTMENYACTDLAAQMVVFEAIGTKKNEDKVVDITSR